MATKAANKNLLEETTITLARPLVRGEKEITEITIRKPADAGVLRGMHILQVVQMEAESIATLTERLTTGDNRLSQGEYFKLDLEDAFEVASVIAGFFNKRSTDEQSPAA